MAAKSQSPRSRYERWKITKLNYENKLCPINNKICDPKPLKSGSSFIVKCAYQGVKVF